MAASVLAVVGSGEYLPAMSAVDRELLARLGATPRVACLPTAAGREGADVIDGWMRRGVEHFDALGASAEPVRVWDRETAGDRDLADRIAAADLVYLSGGSPGYLFDTLVGSSAWEAIMEVVERGGLLAGCSAGAMIQGERFAGLPRSRRGFGLWPGVHLVPHFDEIPPVIVSAMRRIVGGRHTLVGVDANTALLADEGRYTVIGGRVTVWSATSKSVFGPGDLPASAFPD